MTRWHLIDIRELDRYFAGLEEGALLVESVARHPGIEAKWHLIQRDCVAILLVADVRSLKKIWHKRRVAQVARQPRAGKRHRGVADIRTHAAGTVDEKFSHKRNFCPPPGFNALAAQSAHRSLKIR
jgi:hypothetical protein